MATVIPCTLAQLPGLIEKDVERLDRRVKIGLGKAAIDGAHAIEPNLPVAFGDLRKSLHVDAEEILAGHVRIVLDAPQAAALEVGSRPHVPPLEPLIAWVKLRGMQGLTKTGRIRSPGRVAWGNTTAANAHNIALAIRRAQQGLEVTNIKTPEKIARAIQASIAKHGTRPHWMVRSTLPKIEASLQKRMREAVKGDGGD
jgi:hypothetical protein